MTHASLFSGIGGPEVAAAMLGWDNLFHCEINEFGRKVLDYWFPNSKSYEDITKTDFSEWRGRVNVLTGGFPCQPFSYAGKRRGADDDRYLWPYMFRCIDQIRPDWVVAENVAGITTMVEQGEILEMGGQASMFEEVDDIHRYRLEETFTLQRICDDLESHGYTVQPVLVPACAVGAPHRRDRVFIVARRVTADTRSGGQSAPEFESERERTEVQQQSGEQSQHGIGRPSASRPIADTASDGRNGCPCEDWPKRCDRGDTERIEKEDTDGFRLRCEPRTTGGGATVADTESEQGGRCELGQPRSRKPQQEQFGGRSGEDDAERNAADTYGQRPDKPDFASEPSEAQRFDCKENHTSGIAGLGRWDSFPTVSPVHRGNDGLPFDVDRLAIPFSKWRTESLKAYGNAIVPQVMYEIFRAIDLVEKQLSNKSK